MNIYILLALVIVLEFMRLGRNRIVNKFLHTETMSPQSAKHFKDVGVSDMFSAKVLLISGIIKRVGDEQYYLDLSRKIQIEKYRLNILYVIVSLAFVFLIGALGYVLLR
jgi:hypothetical protein